ncbi:GGDEF domain-containing protein [Marinospirillum perlucidum]|uniref:GGDEF domain-containing protein n=1 Tax=Marinospirillum perlucidum TaxID=1982602 RepID=UPI00139069AF|nr:GGDEF domain-containing protein [Marinospirillum perlucidum]
MLMSGKQLQGWLAAAFVLLLLVCGLATAYYLKEAERHVGADYTSMVTDVIRAQASVSELHLALDTLRKEGEEHHLYQLQGILKSIERRARTVLHSLSQSDLYAADYTAPFEEIVRAESSLAVMLEPLQTGENEALDEAVKAELFRQGTVLEQNLAWAYSELNEMLHLASADQRQLMQWLSVAVLSLLLLVVLVVGILMLALLRIHQQKDALLHQSQTDTLTGLYNRRRMYQLAEQELARVHRNGGSLGLVLIDLDHFKQINDTYGHPTGDAVLKAFAGMLVKEIREQDVAVRMGGEEFAVILPDSDLSSAYALAERIREATQALCLPHQVKLTASFGASTAQQPDETFEQLFSRTDKLLYQAKTQGRNRTAID